MGSPSGSRSYEVRHFTALPAAEARLFEVQVPEGAGPGDILYLDLGSGEQVVVSNRLSVFLDAELLSSKRSSLQPQPHTPKAPTPPFPLPDPYPYHTLDHRPCPPEKDTPQSLAVAQHILEEKHWASQGTTRPHAISPNPPRFIHPTASTLDAFASLPRSRWSYQKVQLQGTCLRVSSQQRDWTRKALLSRRHVHNNHLDNCRPEN